MISHGSEFFSATPGLMSLYLSVYEAQRVDSMISYDFEVETGILGGDTNYFEAS